MIIIKKILISIGFVIANSHRKCTFRALLSLLEVVSASSEMAFTGSVSLILYVECIWSSVAS